MTSPRVWDWGLAKVNRRSKLCGISEWERGFFTRVKKSASLTAYCQRRFHLIPLDGSAGLTLYEASQLV